MIVIFWITLFIIMTPYCFYPGFLALVGLRSIRPHLNDKSYQPSVCLIICAHNEEKVIRCKIINSLNITYPKLSIVVVSDGSTDSTDDIVKDFENVGIRLISVTPNLGKTAAQNVAVNETESEIIVFSDANSMYDPGAITAMVKHFSDNRVGCVCGELDYIEKGADSAADNEGFYWKYEQYIKTKEGALGRLLGANGSIYAVRRSLYVPLPREVISDFVEPLMILMQGKRVVYERYARALEETSICLRDEIKRKARIVNRAFKGLLFAKPLMNPFHFPLVAFMLFCHRLIRWFIPLFMVLLFTTDLYIAKYGMGYFAFLMAQILFYLLAIIGLCWPSIRTKVVTIPLYFCAVNYAALRGIILAFSGHTVITWKTVR